MFFFLVACVVGEATHGGEGFEVDPIGGASTLARVYTPV